MVYLINIWSHNKQMPQRSEQQVVYLINSWGCSKRTPQSSTTSPRVEGRARGRDIIIIEMISQRNKLNYPPHQCLHRRIRRTKPKQIFPVQDKHSTTRNSDDVAAEDTTVQIGKPVVTATWEQNKSHSTDEISSTERNSQPWNFGQLQARSTTTKGDTAK